MMHQGYTNGPNPPSTRPGSNTDPSGYPSMYRPDGGSFPNVGGRPPYGPSSSFNQRNADFFGFNSTGPSSGSGIGRGGEPPAKRKRGRPRKAGMDGVPRDPNKPPKRSYVRKKKPENSQVCIPSLLSLIILLTYIQDQRVCFLCNCIILISID